MEGDTGGRPKAGGHITVYGRSANEDGYYELSTIKVERPRDWSGLQTALREKHTIAGIVAEQVKGGFRVDVGVRAFMPASRSGVRDADEMPKLVGQEIRCRITKLDTEKEDVVVDRRAVLEEEQAERRQQALAELREGDVVQGHVRSVMDFGASLIWAAWMGCCTLRTFPWSRVAKASDVVKAGRRTDSQGAESRPEYAKIASA